MKSRGNIFILAAIIILFAFIQADLFSHITIYETKADLLLLISVFAGFHISHQGYAMLTALIAGFVAASLTSAPILFFPLLYLLCAIMGFKIKNRGFRISNMHPVIVALLASILSILFYCAYFIFTDLGCISKRYLIQSIIYTLLNLILALPISALIRIYATDKGRYQPQP